MLALTTAMACSKKDDPLPSPGMTWSVDGSNITAVDYNGQKSGTDIIISGSTSTSNSGNDVYLKMPRRTGTYNLSPSTTDVAAFYFENGTIEYTGLSGSIVVSTVTSDNIKGTFSFNGARTNSSSTKNVTNGKFNINF